MNSKLQRLLCVIPLLLLVVSTAFAQSRIKGKVVDAATQEGLPGATVVVKGTTEAATTDVSGAFTIEASSNNPILVISFVGYLPQEVNATSANVGTIQLKTNNTSINEVVVTANSYAIDRETPVAMSTITSEVIAEKIGNQEFPEVLKSTPGVYATKQGGGFGDSRINVRGFQSQNVAVMINGVPVNDMENGAVYWSNWAGLADVTRSMQVQRGLGASKVAVPSIGGTINIMTRTTDANKGGSFFQGFGNNGYLKTGVSLSTGLSENGWAVSVAGSKSEGNGWAEGTEFEAYNYFFNVSKYINEHHTLSLTGFGAPQRHGQRQNRRLIQEYRNAPQGRRWNSDWGIKDGRVVNVEDNFYHKPQFSLNHYWTIDETSFLSTAAYASMGTGGGGAFSGTLTRTGDIYSPYDLDAAVNANVANTSGQALSFLRASRNDHNWYGVLSTYQKALNENLDLLGGIDFRYYHGKHFTEVTDLLGANFVLNTSDVNNPNAQAKVGDKISYWNDGIVLWEGGFLQAEYKTGPLAAFASFAGSNTSYKRIDYFLYKEDDPMRETDFQNFFGFQVKGGANYNLTETHNVFANVGYFTKAPFFNAVFLNNANVVNPDAKNEKILSYELGYGYRSSIFSANVNLYRTTWQDRSFTRRFPGSTPGSFYFANLLGVDAIHQGVEVDFSFRPVQKLNIQGMLSIGDWRWLNNLDKITVFDETQTTSQTVGPIYMKDIKVGDAAQTTAAIRADYELLKGFKIGTDYNYYADFTADFDPTTLTQEGLQPWKVPNYGTLDLNAVFRFKIGELDASLIGNVNNVLDSEYISDAQAVFQNLDRNPETPWQSNATNSGVFYGVGRTWTTSLRINF